MDYWDAVETAGVLGLFLRGFSVKEDVRRSPPGVPPAGPPGALEWVTPRFWRGMLQEKKAEGEEG